MKIVHIPQADRNATTGWHVEDRDGQATILDVDLAGHAGLAKPRDIRTTIAKAVEEMALKDGAGSGGGENEACFWTETEIIPGFGGTTQKITVYRLNRAAALFVVTRLRTPKAVELTLAIVKVFDQVTSGRDPVGLLPQMAAMLEQMRGVMSLVARQDEEIRALRQDVAGLSASQSRHIVGRATGDHIRARLRTYAALMAPSSREVPSWRQSGTLQLQAVAGFSGKGASWDRLPASDYPAVDRALDGMIAMAERVAARKQMTLVPG